MSHQQQVCQGRSSEGGEKSSNTYRLTNTAFTEVAASLPLPGLPTFLGATTTGLSLFEDKRWQARDDSLLLSQAGKAAELLSTTDISYLYLRDEPRNVLLSPDAEQGSLFAAVLACDPEAFNYSRKGPVKQGEWKVSPAVKTVAHQLGTSGQHIQEAHTQKSILLQSPEDLHTPKSTKATRKRGRDKIEAVEFCGTTQRHVEPDRDAAVQRTCEFLEEVFERTEGHHDDEREEGVLSLSYSDIKNIADEIAGARGKNLLQLVSVGHVVRLLNVLDRHVHLAHDRAIDTDDDEESENFLIVMSGLEAVHTSLLIMTHSDMPKQVYKEEIIDKIVDLLRYQIVHSIFTAYDPLYRQINKSTVQEVDNDDEDEDIEAEATVNSAKKARRSRMKASKSKKINPCRVSGSVTSVLHKVCSILALMKDLLSVERLLDGSILPLIKTILATFGVDNIEVLQLKAMGLACVVFALYPAHRTFIMDEILSLLWKFPSSKRNLRTYQLPNEEAKHVQMLTALFLQLVQCSVTLPEVDLKIVAANEVTTGFMNSIKSLEATIESSTYFWRNVLQRWGAPKAQEGVDIRNIVENLVVDLLTMLNVPEFPAASLLLQVLCVLLFGSAGLKSKDTTVRATAIDLLGQVAACLKQDSVTCSKETLWISQVLQHQDSERGPSAKESCIACKGARGSKFMVACDGCDYWFHGDCMGLTRNDLIDRGWLCHCCVCIRQLSSFESLLKVEPSVGKQTLKGNVGQPPKDFTIPKTGPPVLQQILLNYLQDSVSNDVMSTYARWFYLCQWYRDDPQKEQNLSFYHVRWVSKTPTHDFGMAPTPFSRDVISRISTIVGQQRSLARGFDRILERLLVSLQENSPIPRAKALRAVSGIVEVDPGVLADDRVQRAVEGRFLDSAISVREAALELVGRHIASHPDVATKYFEKIAERIMDTGVSVRKRVIKIIRDICISKSGFSKATDACVRIISRINDDETSIQDLVCKTFFDLWFEEQSNQQLHFAGEGSAVPIEISERTEQLVDVLRNLANYQPLVVIIKRSLALDFCPQAVRNSNTLLMLQATVRNRCELMCKCLLENILKAEETNNEEAEVRALPYVLALHAFCVVDPTLCAPLSDPSRFAVTLQPYLKTQLDNRDVAQLLQSIVFVIDSLIPLLRRPPQSFVEELERDLRQLILRYSFLTVVHACIKCLCSLCKAVPKSVASFEFLTRRFDKCLDSWRESSFGVTEKPSVLRCLFCLGLLVRYGADLLDSTNEEITLEQILSLVKFYLYSEDFDVKVRSLQALGFIFIAKPDFMMEKDMEKMINATLSSSVDSRIKMQTLRNFYDYLLDVEGKMGLQEVGNDATNKDRQEMDGIVPVAAGAGDNNICGGIIQFHWEQILERCIDMNDQVRQAALKVVEIVLRQGLVHPMTCVPYLIALEVDQKEPNFKLAHRLLMHMNEKYPSFFESRLGDGLQLSFRFIESGAASSGQRFNMDRSSDKVDTLASAKTGVSRIYKLIRASRVSRNKFLSSVVRKFDIATWGPSSSVSFLLYCTEILASLPFSLMDEPLYLVYAINRVVQVRAGIIEANIKALISEGPLEVVIKQVSEGLAAERQKMGENASTLEEAVHATNKKSCTNNDIQDIPHEALMKLKDDCHAAVAVALLLRLKRYLKISYNLNDPRCQAFSPTEPIKPGEVLTRQNVKEFVTNDIPTDSADTISQMLDQYQAFKRLLKEDSMDYSTYTAHVPRKRNRLSISTSGQQADGGGGGADCQENGQITPSRSLRRKSVVPAAGPNVAISSGDEEKNHYDSDEEYSGSGKAKQRRKGNTGGGHRTKARKPHL